MTEHAGTALVTGGSRGIGRAISLELARAGHDIVFTYYRNRAGAEETRQEIEALGRRATAESINLGEPRTIEELFDELASRDTRLRVFVHSAVSAVLRPLLDLPERHWDHVITANLTAFLLGVRRAVPLLENGGSIIAITSSGPVKYLAGYGALATAKAGMETVARYLAVELADRGLNVNVVCPGMVDTDALDAFKPVVPDLDAFKRQIAEQAPTGRLTSPEDVASVVRFLCSPAASAIRGQRIVVDEGVAFGS